MTTAAILVVVFVLAIGVGVPIAPALGSAAMLGVVFGLQIPPQVVAQQALSAVASYPLLAIPYFIAAGAIMEKGGVSRPLVRLAQALVGAFPGGLGLATVATSAFFAGITGSGIADTAAIGSVSIPAMVEEGYDVEFAAALQASAGIVGPLIPPSILFVALGVVTNLSIGKLLIAGVLPGLLVSFFLLATTLVIALRRGYRPSMKFQLQEVVRAFRDAFWALLMPVIILGGIYSGIFTPTEAAAVSAFYGVLVSLFIYRELSWRELPRVLYQAGTLSAMVMYLVATASVFSWALTAADVTPRLAQAATNLSSSPVITLMVIAVVMLVAGAVLDQAAAVVLLPPILYPIALRTGVDPIHFGVVVVTALCIGLVLPPIGFNVAVVAGITHRRIEAIFRATMPYLAALLAALVVIILVPQLSTFLVGRMH